VGYLEALIKSYYPGQKEEPRQEREMRVMICWQAPECKGKDDAAKTPGEELKHEGR